MYGKCWIGKQEFITNELGEKDKSIVFDDSFLLFEEKEVKRAEFYQAMSTGLNVEKVISINKYEYYLTKNNAKRVFVKVEDTFTLEHIEYTVVREYSKDSDNVELTLKRGVEIGST